ncbi:MAG: hypothetical protein ABR941_10000 [Thermoleophilia bacterium]
MQAGRQEDGPVAVAEQAIDCEVDAAALVQTEIDAEGADAVDLALQHVGRHAVVGDPDPQHAAGDRQRLEHGGGVAELGEVAGTGEAGGPAADDGDLLVVDDGKLVGQLRGTGDVADEPLEAGDGQRFVDRAPGAGRLTGVGTDAAADRRKGIGFGGDAIGVGEAALCDQGDVALRRRLDGAVALAGGVALLVDDVGVGDRLRVELVDRLALAELLVVLVLDGDGADRHALAAAGALVGIDESGVVLDRGVEAAWSTLEPGEL